MFDRYQSASMYPGCFSAKKNGQIWSFRTELRPNLRPCGCFVPFLAIIAYLLMVLVLLLFTALSLIAGLFFALPLSCGCCHLYSWKCSRAWNTDVYQKLIYFFYYFQHRGIKDPKASAEFMPVEGMAPRRVLEKPNCKQSRVLRSLL